MGSKVYRRQVCMSPVHREVPKTNGHSLSLPTSITPELHATPRLGRPLNLKSYGTPRYSLRCMSAEAGWVNVLFGLPLRSCRSRFMSSACSLARRTAVAPACMRKPSPSKWCKAQRTAPHLAVRKVCGNAAPRRRSVVRMPQQWVQSSACVCFCWPCFLFCFVFLPRIFPVGPRGGEGCLPASLDHGFGWPVVFCSQRQLSHHREVAQRFVSVFINLLVVLKLYSISLRSGKLKSQITMSCIGNATSCPLGKGNKNKSVLLCRSYFNVGLDTSVNSE